MKEARSSGVVARGWVPSQLPESATGLRELHDTDTNEVWGTFRLPGNEHALASTVARVEATQIAGHTVRPPQVSWWPESLTGKLPRRARGRRDPAPGQTAPDA